MNTALDKITAFIRKHHVMTVATVAGGRPWTAHVFYAWVADRGLFVFTSGGETRHGAEMAVCADVAAGIALETRTVGRLQGLQVEGTVRKAEGTELDAARRAYIKRFPYAAVAELSLWLLDPSLMKLTDNTLGFGKKLIWTK